MSARPRPVTATFPPPPLLSPVHLQPRSLTPSPLNSTASLLSILNRNSYESDASLVTRCDGICLKASKNQNVFTEHYFLENSSMRQTNLDEEHLTTHLNHDCFGQNLKNYRPTVFAAASLKELEQLKSVDAAKIKCTRIICSKPSLKKSISNEQKLIDSDHKMISKVASDELSAWEKWIIQKAKENRSKTEEEIRQQQIKLKEEEIIQKQKEEKKKENERAIKNWIKEHDLQKKQEMNAELLKKQEEKELKERNKKLMSEKANVKFNEWLKKKSEKEIKMKKEMADRKAKELAEKENRQKKSEEAFNEWIRVAQSRPRTAPHSFGYSDGKLTGYYDSGAYPIPSYINPVPWQPIEVPKPKFLVKKKQLK